LLDLIRFGKRASRLEVQNLGDIRPSEDVVAALYPFGKAKSQKERAQVAEADIGVCGALENS